MKKTIALFGLSLLLFSCTQEEERYASELKPVFEVDMPTAFAKDSVTEIPIRYKKVSTCHLFDGFYYDRDGMNRTVAIHTIKLNQDNCQTDADTNVEVNLEFRPVALGTYHFKFWKGENAQGVDEFMEFDAVVNH
jgi:hypothetical protein